MEWLGTFSWLCYSPVSKGGLCLPCVLFGNELPKKGNRVKKLFLEPVTHWPDAKAAFIRHESTLGGLHKECMYLYLNFLERMSGKVEPVNVLLDNKLKTTIQENRERLIPIIDTIIFCGRNGLPLRGHRDDSKYDPEVGLYSTGGVGLFIELLNYRVRGGDKVLENHLKNHRKNASYKNYAERTDKMLW